MLDVTALLEEIKASPFEEVDILAPHTGVVSFPDIAPGAKVHGPRGTWKEVPGTTLATLERERNPKPIVAPQTGDLVWLATDMAGTFVEAGTPIARIRHYLSKEEVQQIILKQALHLFRAPDRAKYYFTPEVDLKIKASGPRSVTVYEGLELFIMSRMKREAPVSYQGPEGVIYAVYFQHNQNVDAGEPLVGVCPPEQLTLIEDVVVRVQTEWQEQG
ncbi:hypothetical protein [Megalodesulfovibrio gigas]|uniref:Biotin/lipoyl attachment domain-containing protein n=1 Tax=Megalodesulfovibrio gigas (strain ATCC 19364 / DSM 1382 / NCIMB 9332 / VKM B-1759) TaxID=1121448 RepID=T2GFZ1_MEGG1|nr:hypothetical protein [Megalodesulfovibrio gigas]AGW15124.1 hypothetical protein DGI_3444 [Megalodesulfovibrio gigas DSM 1382 = ATCC 19364]